MQTSLSSRPVRRWPLIVTLVSVLAGCLAFLPQVLFLITGIRLLWWWLYWDDFDIDLALFCWVMAGCFVLSRWFMKSIQHSPLHNGRFMRWVQHLLPHEDHSSISTGLRVGLGCGALGMLVGSLCLAAGLAIVFTRPLLDVPTFPSDQASISFQGSVYHLVLKPVNSAP
ncbi:hypothetical protein [Ktedonobacter robiniae]|uniref:hypothetical protein n=1 Tax=Ktedonobacter robiniae TaxID=2778365 RepID=UPI001916BA1A|nr:hypothetical protein [Ktedonobacter robiniae]